jgi:hypothetical protein
MYFWVENKNQARLSPKALIEPNLISGTISFVQNNTDPNP